jgi:CHASE3 domain sensor protein
MRWTIARKIIIGFGLGWLALVGVGAVAYRTTNDLITQVAQVRHIQYPRSTQHP